MPREERVYSVFVASPSDLSEERARLEEVIKELNMTWSRELGLRFDLIRWETHSFPGVGKDAQAVIDQQIPADYDLFIGLMWHRFGTPTTNAGSGTEHEFFRAHSRHQSSPDSVQIMFYFKDAPVVPSELNPEQLGKVQSFKRSLGKEGVLYWIFRSLDEFEKLARMHLARQAMLLRKEIGAITNRTPNTSSAEGAAEDGDLGLIELSELYDSRFSELVVIAERISKAIADLTERMHAGSAEIQALSQGGTRVDPTTAKRSIAKVAADMDHFTARVEAELPLFGDSLNEGMTALTRAAALMVDLQSGREDSEKSLPKLRELRTILSGTESSIFGFRNSVASLPRMTADLNRAKRRVVSVLDRMVEQIRKGQSLAGAAERVMQTSIDSAPRVS